MAKIMHRHVINIGFLLLITFLIIGGTVLCFIAFMWAGMGRNQQMDFVTQNYPEYYQEFLALSNFAIYPFGIMFKLIGAGCFFAGFLFAIFYSFIIFDMFSLLTGMRKKLSVNNFSRHRAAVKSLVAQLFASLLCLVPPLCLVATLIAEYERAQETVQALLAIFSLHSMLNAIILVVTTPPYRLYLIKLLPCISKKTSRVGNTMWLSTGVVHSIN
uniref:G protein-coupled receptor n=1 Tax=Caenorhabditis japonica TaxID=281687 RepID=A0A8R1DM02_CAEJA